MTEGYRIERRGAKGVYEGEVLRLGSSDVVHISDGGRPACGMWDPDEKDPQSASAEAAVEFFDLCETCTSCFDPERELTTAQMREEIADAMEIPLGESEAFDARHISTLYELIVKGNYVE